MFTSQKTLTAGLFVLAFSGLGQAEEYKWPLCDALPGLIAAGEEDTPFKSLSDRTKLGESMGYRDAPAALKMESKKRRCFVYVAGSPEGVVGGGEYNKIECVTYRSPFGERLRMSEVIPERAYLGGILGTCEALKDWTYEAPSSEPGSRYSNDIWTDPETGVQVVAQLEESRSRSKSRRAQTSVRQEVKFIVRAPNPSYIDPDEAFRRMQAEQKANK
ncbi:MAG: hypothetical protein AAGF20_08865 [Pseudomonadota bacterium]